MFWMNFSKAAIKEECQALALFCICVCSLSETLQRIELFTLPECPRPQHVGKKDTDLELLAQHHLTHRKY